MQKKAQFLFVIPAFKSFTSGGNEYNFQLTKALLELGALVRIHTFEEHPSWHQDDIIIWDSLYLFKKSKAKKGKHYLLVHHLESLYPPQDWTSKAFSNTQEMQYLKHFDGFITSSNYTREYLEEAGFGHLPIITVLPALATRPKVVSSAPNTPLKVILVANIIERKGIYPFLKHLSEEKITNISITIIGEGRLEPAYFLKCEPFWISSNVIDYKGSLPHGDVLAAYAESDLFISTSYMETYGMAIQEAVACGVPLLLLEGGNVKNHLHNRNGYLCQTLPELVERLRQLSTDTTSLKAMKKNAITLANKPMRTWRDAARELMIGLP